MNIFDVNDINRINFTKGRKKNILFLADLNHQANVVLDHIESISELSHNNFYSLNPIHYQLYLMYN